MHLGLSKTNARYWFTDHIYPLSFKQLNTNLTFILPQHVKVFSTPKKICKKFYVPTDLLKQLCCVRAKRMLDSSSEAQNIGVISSPHISLMFYWSVRIIIPEKKYFLGLSTNFRLRLSTTGFFIPKKSVHLHSFIKNHFGEN